MDEMRERLLRYLSGCCDKEMLELLRITIYKLPDEEIRRLVTRLDEAFNKLRDAIIKLSRTH